MQYPVYADCRECPCLNDECGFCNLGFTLIEEDIELDGEEWSNMHVSSSCGLKEIKGSDESLLFYPYIIEWEKAFELRWSIYKPGIKTTRIKTLLHDKTLDQGEK